MPNRNLDQEQLAKARALVVDILARLKTLSGEDKELLFAYRRKVAKELIYAERSGPMARRKLKAQKRKEQGGLYVRCHKTLPEKYAVLDRTVASAGYTSENTKLICETCDRSIQAERGYA
jgi:hypothetical protein